MVEFFDSDGDVIGEDEIEEGQRKFRVSPFEFRIQSSEISLVQIGWGLISPFNLVDLATQ